MRPAAPLRCAARRRRTFWDAPWVSLCTRVLGIKMRPAAPLRCAAQRRRTFWDAPWVSPRRYRGSAPPTAGVLSPLRGSVFRFAHEYCESRSALPLRFAARLGADERFGMTDRGFRFAHGYCESRCALPLRFAARHSADERFGMPRGFRFAAIASPLHPRLGSCRRYAASCFVLLTGIVNQDAPCRLLSLRGTAQTNVLG